jgi:secreted trypsin-like serine protease
MRAAYRDGGVNFPDGCSRRRCGPGHIQAGITGWGVGCGATGFSGVYTRLSNRGVGNFILSVTGGVPVTSSRAASAARRAAAR